ncbi:MAG: trypsin-like peptidase domain-containing protein [Acetatifactor sp.]|nr:trypsin-like peptidase domain-containing protein [Acetatifactor sp.]
MEYSYIEKRYNVMGLASIEAFAGIKGGMNGNCKDVYFLRVTGVNQTFSKDIACMDETQTGKMLLGQGIYNRVGTFPRNIEADRIACYIACYRNWLDTGRERLFTAKLDEKSNIGELLSTSCKKVLEVYHTCNQSLNESIEKNFVVKLLYWLDELAFGYLKEWNPRQSMKFVAQGVTKEQEYFFCYLLTLLGIDVLLLQNEVDIDEKIEALHLSKQVTLGGKKAITLDAYNSQNYAVRKENPAAVSQESGQVRAETGTRTPRVVIPPGRHGSSGNAGVGQRESGRTTPPAAQELDFEELALRASSVVMISIHDEKGDIIGSGSGIMIGREGYILTNNHVARGGRFYSVRIENDDNMYRTEEIIKYNSLLDLAVIRIDRTLQPLPIYRGSKPLVRGQKVVAIGSPLGLFNSVSNGIISGFRRMNDVDMIQFTAPISHGSSGGAVLNMYGEVIGVSTAGIDEGQNINLAVGYEFINTFIKGFQ